MSKKIRAFIGYLKVLVNGETLGGGFYRFLSVHACFLVLCGRTLSGRKNKLSVCR